MRIVFMGTPDFALMPFKALLKSRHEIAAVVTQPDKPNTRGNKIVFSPVKSTALENAIPVLQPKSIRDNNSVKEITQLKPEAVVVVAYGQLLPKELLDYPMYGCINIHASLLPKYRGSAPINWSIINGESKSGVTTMFMDEGMDTGDIIYQKEAIISEDMTAGKLYDILAQYGSELIIKTLDDIESSIAPRTRQNDKMSSYAPMLNKDTGKINWDSSTAEIIDLVRGTNPWPVAYTVYEGARIKIFKVNRCEEKIDDTIEPGKIIKYQKGEGLLVKTRDGALYLDTIQFPNRRKMHVDNFLMGNEININAILK